MTSGKWIKKDGEILWEITKTNPQTTKESIVSLQRPEDRNFSKSALFKVIVAEEHHVEGSFRKTRFDYFVSEIRMQIKEGYKYVYLRKSGKNYYVSDLWHGQTFIAPMQNTEYLKFSMTEFKPITFEEAKKLFEQEDALTFDSYDEQSGDFGKAVTLKD